MSETTFKLIFNDLPKITAMLEPRAEAIIAKTARDVESAAKMSMGEQKTGNVYIRGGKRHIASAPGEAPAIDTGALVNSIKAESAGRLSWVIFAEAEYGAILELFRQRPWLEPALQGRASAFNKAMEALIDE